METKVDAKLWTFVKHSHSQYCIHNFNLGKIILNKIRFIQLTELTNAFTNTIHLYILNIIRWYQKIHLLAFKYSNVVTKIAFKIAF